MLKQGCVIPPMETFTQGSGKGQSVLYLAGLAEWPNQYPSSHPTCAVPADSSHLFPMGTQQKPKLPFLYKRPSECHTQTSNSEITSEKSKPSKLSHANMLKKSLVNAFCRRSIRGTEENRAVTKMGSFKSADGPTTTGWK